MLNYDLLSFEVPSFEEEEEFEDDELFEEDGVEDGVDAGVVLDSLVLGLDSLSLEVVG